MPWTSWLKKVWAPIGAVLLLVVIVILIIFFADIYWINEHIDSMQWTLDVLRALATVVLPVVIALYLLATGARDIYRRKRTRLLPFQILALIAVLVLGGVEVHTRWEASKISDHDTISDLISDL